MKTYWVYIVASRPRGALYIGLTSDLSRRVWEHKTRTVPGHAAKYDIDKLVYYEPFDRPDDAIAREKRLKKWRRAWKVELIETVNPQWTDLYERLSH